MPAPVRRLSLSGAKDLIASLALSPARRGATVGLELELIPSQPHADVVERLAGTVWPGGSALTFEPGGQVELSGPCFPSPDAACAAMALDLGTLAGRGVVAQAVGIDPLGGRPRVLHSPRYDAMDAYFIDAGRTMMRETAALQINVDVADDRRWRALHAVGPVLAAAFANSPMAAGQPTPWKSNRGRCWLAIDHTRTSPVGGTSQGTWVDYALDAHVMMLRQAADRFVVMDQRMTLRDWIEHGHPAGWPDEDDVAYHLTTLFPPIRLRGWVELRFLDALPSPWWQVAVHTVWRLLDDPAAVEAVCVGTDTLWLEAARFGVTHPVLGAAAEAVLSTVPEAGEFVERFTARRRCPGDDLLVAATR